MKAALAAMLSLLVAASAEAATFRVTSTADDGAGSLREAILAANGAPGSVIEFDVAAGSVIEVERALPALVAEGLHVEGRGVTLREAEGCERPGRKKGCDGLVILGPRIAVRNLKLAGFTFDGIGVVGDGARDVVLRDIQAVDNLDDGIGVSAGAGPVTAERCLLMGNGFRTKGKGLLVFEDSTALLRDSVVIANRDGVTVTHGSKARLERVFVAGNYDKGLGVSGASVEGRDVRILANGTEGVAPEEEAAPNADGLRVGLDGRAELADSLIAGSGDSGVVVLDTSRVKLEATTIEANRGSRTTVSPSGRLSE